MKKIVLLVVCLFAFVSVAEARKCLVGAVVEIDENGHSRIVSCEKWERNVEAVVAEQDAINNAYAEENEALKSGNYEIVESEDSTPGLGKLQNKIDNIGKSIFGLIGF